MRRRVARGSHPAFQIKRRCLHAVNLSLDGRARKPLGEPATQFGNGLLSEFLGALSFRDPQFKLGAGFRRELGAGLLID